MRKPKLTDEQIVALLREAERGENTIIEICKKAGVSEQTFYRWRNKFSGHADTRMVEEHYGHLCETAKRDAIRTAAPRIFSSIPAPVNGGVPLP